jgi:hypothetical protein
MWPHIVRQWLPYWLPRDVVSETKRSIRAPRLLSRIGPADAASDRSVNGAADRGRQRNQDHLGALAAHAQNPVPVFFAEVGDVRASGLEDPQAQ